MLGSVTTKASELYHSTGADDVVAKASSAASGAYAATAATVTDLAHKTGLDTAAAKVSEVASSAYEKAKDVAEG